MLLHALIAFVLAPWFLGQSFFNVEGQFSLENYKLTASQNLTYLKMSFQLCVMGIMTLVTLIRPSNSPLLTRALGTVSSAFMPINLAAWHGLTCSSRLCLYRFLVSMALLISLGFKVESVRNKLLPFLFILVVLYYRASLMIFTRFSRLDDMVTISSMPWPVHLRETFRRFIFSSLSRWSGARWKRTVRLLGQPSQLIGERQP